MEKPSSLIFVYFLLLVFIIQSISSADDFIYDIAGKKVNKTSLYYIGPVNWANGGGIKLTNSKCPVHVIQDPKANTKGDPFEFVLSGLNQQYLRIGWGVSISIDLSKLNGKCKESSYLKIDDFGSKPPLNFMKSGGLFNTAVTCFQFVKYPKPTNAKMPSYMLQICPFACGAGPLRCFNISTSVYKGTKYLGISGTPFELVFKKAST